MQLAVAQAPADLGTPAARIAWLAECLPQVAAKGAALLLLPELFACGYNIGSSLRDLAEPRDGPAFDAVAQLARQHGVAIHYGYAEQSGGRVYNAAQCVGPGGSRLVHQRKLAIPPGFERDVFHPGKGCALFSYGGLRIATLICYDAEFAETVRHVAAMGADLVLVPTALGADWAWVAQTMIPTRAYENGIYLAYANSAGVQNGMSFLGSSVIAAPNGAEAARAGADPQILYATLDKSVVQAAQARLPYLEDSRALCLDTDKTPS